LLQTAVVEKLTDSGIMSLCFAARYLGVFADSEEIHRHHIHDSASASKEDLICAAKKLGLKARLIATDWEGLQNNPLPAVACLKDGSFLVAGRFTDGKVLVQYPTQGRPQLLGSAEFNVVWTGELILLGRRTGIAHLARIFGFK
jgi:subfamily B ATP-binding cassette protein HlyB/CyaB